MTLLVREAAVYRALGQDYHRMFYWWVALGVPAFLKVPALYALMIFWPVL